MDVKRQPLVREKGGVVRIEDLRRLLGDAKRQAGQEVVGVGSVEKTGERLPAEGSYHGRWNGGKTTFLGTKFRAESAKIVEKRHIP